MESMRCTIVLKLPDWEKENYPHTLILTKLHSGFQFPHYKNEGQMIFHISPNFSILKF